MGIAKNMYITCYLWVYHIIKDKEEKNPRNSQILITLFLNIRKQSYIKVIFYQWDSLRIAVVSSKFCTMEHLGTKIAG